MQWYRMDLHLHTPASQDYQQDASYLDILQQAERRGLNIIALTDHNTVKGFRQIMEEIKQLDWLESLQRIQPEELARLNDYRRLIHNMLVLPGFEFTATFGFHIIGVFSPQSDVRQIEHLLLDLNISPESLDAGDSNVGASSDVLTVYEAINRVGGIVIAAHANSSHGVAMRGMSFGGQTRIAYTQDSKLHALEVTDLDRKDRHTTARFFDGSKPEYPRAMRCIQGSDAHRLERDPQNPKNLGVGERVTEIQLEELSFEAMYAVFAGNDMARTRPFQGSTAPYDHVYAARQEGPSIVQAFHESAAQKGGHLYAVVADVCAFANTNGGTIYVGASANVSEKPSGISNINQAIEDIRGETQRKITPPVELHIDILHTQNVPVIRIQVPRGSETPYAIDDNKIYVRDENETSVAVRDEIVQLVQHTPGSAGDQPAQPADGGQVYEPFPAVNIDTPRTGVEVIATERRNSTTYHHVRDLRNGNIVRNVTKASARKLWHYAITQVEEQPKGPREIIWHGNLGVVKIYSKSGKQRYDLAQQINGTVHIYYGVTEDGLQDSTQSRWRELLGLEDED